MKCKSCGKDCWKNGVDNGVQRFRCKSCFKCFSDSSPKYSEQDREKAIHMYVNNCGVRKTALFMNCSPGTILNWVRAKSGEVDQKPSFVDGDTIEMDEIWAQADRRIAHKKKKDHI